MLRKGKDYKNDWIEEAIKLCIIYIIFIRMKQRMSLECEANSLESEIVFSSYTLYISPCPYKGQFKYFVIIIYHYDPLPV